ncbi:hypothetical protein PsorP6_011349 [Peronosclerospora sorghi]|uniref:Uncharacterized protein n=1 Tax=Peronosclerospora sorghi TaxID=230839 RepID=A0ACC0WJ67_9STRA|nr:hypothetical protein PsorP6_011349 [Peronosclerospora sorghi]
MAFGVTGHQGNWRVIRAKVRTELLQRRLYTDESEFDALVHRVSWFEQGICPGIHWFQMPQMGEVFANSYERPLHFFSFQENLAKQGRYFGLDVTAWILAKRLHPSVHVSSIIKETNALTLKLCFDAPLNDIIERDHLPRLEARYGVALKSNFGNFVLSTRHVDVVGCCIWKHVLLSNGRKLAHFEWRRGTPVDSRLKRPFRVAARSGRAFHLNDLILHFATR